MASNLLYYIIGGFAFGSEKLYEQINVQLWMEEHSNSSIARCHMWTMDGVW